jgi:hypothetical protein
LTVDYGKVDVEVSAGLPGGQRCSVGGDEVEYNDVAAHEMACGNFEREEIVIDAGGG